MYLVVLAGGIASGKSTVAAELEARGAYRIDLDQLSRDVCAAGSPAVRELAREFGPDVVDGRTGELMRPVLAERAFASAERTRALEGIVHPHIMSLLERRLAAMEGHGGPCVVEVPLPDRVPQLLSRADEVVCVVCPLQTRRERAQGRGMDAGDFDARVQGQPDDGYLLAHADTAFVNDGDKGALRRQIDAWWDRHAATNWSCG